MATYPSISRSVASQAPRNLSPLPLCLLPVTGTFLSPCPAGKQWEYSRWVKNKYAIGLRARWISPFRRERTHACREINQRRSQSAAASRSLAFDYARTFRDRAWRVENSGKQMETRAARGEEGFPRLEKTDPLENRDWWVTLGLKYRSIGSQERERERGAFNVECWWRVMGFSWGGVGKFRENTMFLHSSIFQYRIGCVNKRGECWKERRR